MFCSNCGSPNNITSKFCSKCGHALPPDEQSIASKEGDRHVAPPSPTPEQFYRAAIGPQNQDYYLSKFLRFNQGGASWSWNWGAFFLTFYWLIYRKMWLNALIYFVLPYVIIFTVVFAGTLMGGGESVVGMTYFLVLAVLFVIPPLYGDALYHRHCRKKIAEANANLALGDEASRLQAVAKSGGVSRVLLIVGAIFLTIMLIGIVAAIAIPAYQQYVTKAEAAEQSYTQVTLPYEQAEKVTGNAGLQYNSLFGGTIYNGSDYNLRHITVEITAKEKDGTVRWVRKFVDDLYIAPLTTGALQISVGGAENAELEWAIVEVKGIPATSPP